MLTINQVAAATTPHLKRIKSDPKFIGQFQEVQNHRKRFDISQQQMAKVYGDTMMANQAARIPQDVFREFDSQSVEIYRQLNLTLMEDLASTVSRSLSIGKIEFEYRQAGDANEVTTSINGQVPAKRDKTPYTYDGAIVPYRQASFGRGWREWAGQQSENFDGLVDDQANATRAILDEHSRYIYEGDDSIAFNGRTGYGIKNAPNTQLVDLGASGLNIDFADSNATASDIRTAFTALVYELRRDNNVRGEIDFYISMEIEENFQRIYDSTGGLAGRTIMSVLMDLAGVKSIKTDQTLSGNEVVGMVMQSQYIQLLSGMALSTVPVVRHQPTDDYNFVVHHASGILVKADAEGRSGVLYARAA